MYYFTADEHYGHKNIIKYCDRPFDSVDEMDRCMISRNNEVVTSHDTVVHIGDFSLYSRVFNDVHSKYIKSLKGNHIFIPGSHDQWLKGTKPKSHIWQRSIEKQQIICCHYSMAVWPASHWNSWHLFGHTHGQIEGIGKSFDVGVDAHDFRPVPFSKVRNIMECLPDNPGLIQNKN